MPLKKDVNELIDRDSVDQRVLRTRSQLREALLELILEKGYENITTREIARRGGVGYKTFYRHFSNKDALLFDVLTSLGNELNEQLLPSAYDLNLLAENGRQLFRFIARRAGTLRILLDRQVAVLMLEPLRPFTDRWLREMVALAGKKSDIPVDFYANHLLWSSLGIIRWWLESEEPLAEEEIAAAYVEMAIKPVVAAVFGVREPEMPDEIGE